MEKLNIVLSIIQVACAVVTLICVIRLMKEKK